MVLAHKGADSIIKPSANPRWEEPARLMDRTVWRKQRTVAWILDLGEEQGG